MRHQVLNGDSLADKFPADKIEGKIIVCREALIEGPVNANSLQEFWQMRAGYLASAYNENKSRYYQDNVYEFDKLLSIPSDSEIYLWFEYDLFCQVNMWFVLRLLYTANQNFSVYRVHPVLNNADNLWEGFGWMSEEELEKCFDLREALSNNDLQLGNELWQAYSNNDLHKLMMLSAMPSTCLPYLNKVCKAHIERFSTNGNLGRPQKAIKKLLDTGVADFHELFKKFSQAEGVYGLEMCR